MSPANTCNIDPNSVFLSQKTTILLERSRLQNVSEPNIKTSSLYSNLAANVNTTKLLAIFREATTINIYSSFKTADLKPLLKSMPFSGLRSSHSLGTNAPTLWEDASIIEQLWSFGEVDDNCADGPRCCCVSLPRCLNQRSTAAALTVTMTTHKHTTSR